MSSRHANRHRAPSRMPAKVINRASNSISRNRNSGGAPITLKSWISCSRSRMEASNMALKPRTAEPSTSREISRSAFSRRPIICHSSVNAMPGRMAMSGSPLNSLISLCILSVAALDFRPSIAPVMWSGSSSDRSAASLFSVLPGIFTPCSQPICMASIPSRLTCNVWSTGVPVGARMPTTVNGASS